MIGSVEAGEPLQLVQRAGAIEDFSIQFDGSVRGVDRGSHLGGSVGF